MVATFSCHVEAMFVRYIILLVPSRWIEWDSACKMTLEFSKGYSYMVWYSILIIEYKVLGLKRVSLLNDLIFPLSSFTGLTSSLNILWYGPQRDKKNRI